MCTPCVCVCLSMKNLYKQRQFNFVVMNVSGRLLPAFLLVLIDDVVVVGN